MKEVVLRLSCHSSIGSFCGGFAHHSLAFSGFMDLLINSLPHLKAITAAELVAFLTALLR